MKRRLFQDLITETKLPQTFWKFFFLSIILHGVMFYFLVNMKMEPMERLELKANANSNMASRQPSTSSGGGDFGVDRNAATGTEPSNDSSMPTPGSAARNGVNYAAAGRIANHDIVEPYSVSSGDEPAELTGAVPEAKPLKFQYQPPRGSFNEDEFMKFYSKPFTDARKKRESSFGVKKRTTTYPKIKNMIERRELPPEQMVKIDEMINYFYYDYPLPDKGEPFSITTEVAPCPWNPSRLLVHVGLQGKVVIEEIKEKKRVIASDMDMKVEFNTDRVKAYRLVGHGARKPKLGEVREKWKEGKELHMGQSFTSLYEVIPSDKPAQPSETDETAGKKDEKELELGTVKITYKEPGKPKTWEISQTFMEPGEDEEEISEDFKFSAVVAQFSMILKNPEQKVVSVLQMLLESAQGAVGDDPTGQRAEFVKLLETYIMMISRNEK
jgi:hypothetical protein